MTEINALVRKYFERMAEIRSTGGATKETSYYSALENLLNDLGAFLDPKVICNGQLKNQGAGHPDFGLYTKKQCTKGEPKPGQLPERGVIEVKPLADNSWQTCKSDQATKYFNHYKLVLVTNYREFRLIGEDDAGKPIQREFYSLAKDETTFWAMAAHPTKSAKDTGAHFSEFLRRVMMTAAPLSRPEDIAWFLASYARDALATLEAHDATALAPLRSALETALGIKFEGEKGEHFFRSTLIQTLFYGVFSAWVIWARTATSGKFDWKSAGFYLTVPMVQSLFEEIAKPTKLKPLGIMDLLDRTSEALNRVDRTTFFKTFDSGQAVQHFYEPFLEAFDPALRKDLGVWYTPPEIVKYMVERVDTVLRSELGIADGLADPNVYVLDPCCGTGAFVVEVLRKIESTLIASRGADPLIGEDVKEAAHKRIFGFEIMSAPFVIAHWQVGNLLAGLKAPLDPSKNERPAVYLTNALTGWEPPTGAKATLPMFPELEAERDQAENVKRNVPILVILGNPPYNAFAGTSPDEENGLVEPYKEGLKKDWNIGKFNLDELYVRFLRIAERKIAETGKGVVCYVSSYSYVGDQSFVVARKRLLSEFDSIWIDSLNGDSRETGKRTPTGDPDPSAFSTPFNKAGIRLGTAVGLFVRTSGTGAASSVRFRDFWGTSKREDLVNSLNVSPFDAEYEIANPADWNKLSFRPNSAGATYRSWPLLNEFPAIAPINGLMEKRGGALIDIDDAALTNRMKTYFDPSIDWAAYELLGERLAKDAARFDAEAARKKALASSFSTTNIARYLSRPFDVRFAYYTDIRPIWNEPRPDLWAQFSAGNRFLVTRKAGVAKPEGAPIIFTRCLGDNDAQRGHSYYFPFENHVPGKGMLPGTTEANLSAKARAYLAHLGLPNPDKDAAAQAALWHHVLAISYAPTYLSEHEDGLSVDWPRIPLPADNAALTKSADLGAKVAALLDTENPVVGVNSGAVAEHLKVMGLISANNLRVAAGWGSKDNKGRVNPGRGKTEQRAWTDAEKAAMAPGFAALGLTETQALGLLGKAVDVYLNDTTFWRAVPETVWNYHIGGYQVLKKWLSYREEGLLGRHLTKNEAQEVTGMVRRMAALVLAAPELDANYAAVKTKTYKW